MRKQFLTLRYIRVSYARLFFIFWFISLRADRQVEPQEMYLYKHYGREHLYEFGSLFFIYLAKKPFYEYFVATIPLSQSKGQAKLKEKDHTIFLIV